MFALLRWSLLALASSSLSACDDPAKMWRQSEIEQIVQDTSGANADLAGVIDHNAESSRLLKQRVESLEMRLQHLEQENAKLRREMLLHRH